MSVPVVHRIPAGAFAIVLSMVALVGCRASEAPVQPELIVEDGDSAGFDDPAAPIAREFVLPPTVVPRSDELGNFGIDVTTLALREREVVESAWGNYQRVLAGKAPECPLTFALSDGGSAMYDCGTYTLMRRKGLSDATDASGRPGFDYGPMLDFLNGHKVQRLRFMSYDELRRLEAAAGR
jgi:hypothetical protein